jgi:tRNA (guanine37-N1)-methyltransferase
MKIDILTLFPEMFEGPFGTSMLKKAQDGRLVEIIIHNLRNWAKDKHKTVDDRPFGGGPGIILKVEPIYLALKELKVQATGNKLQVVLLSAKGQKYTQKKAQELSRLDHLIVIAGHYEGVDHRVHKHLVNEIVSIGEYVLTGGEIPAMVLVDSIVRLIPGVLKPESLKEESFSPKSETEYPQYTRPENYKGWKVPKVLLSGNHKEIDKWRKRKSLQKNNK